MRVRVAGLVLPCVLMVPIVAHANDHNADYAASFSLNNGGSWLQGVQSTIAKSFNLRNAPTDPRPICAPGLVAEVSAYFGEHDDSDLGNNFLLAGGRCSFAKSRNFIHALVLVGMSYTSDGLAGDGPKDFAIGYGAAWDFAFGSHHDPTPQDMTEYAGWGTRVQVDFVERKGEREGVTRISFGAMYRFPKR